MKHRNVLKEKCLLDVATFYVLISMSCRVSSMVARWCSGYHTQLVYGKKWVRILLGTQTFLSFQRHVSKAACKLFTSFYQCF